MSKSSKMNKLAIERSDISICDLPDGVLEHILSFLSSSEVVRTCVLSKRWCHLWKSVPALRITGESIYGCCEFMDSFLVGRHGTPIDVCDLGFIDYHKDEEFDVNAWIFLVVVTFQVRELRVIIMFDDDFLWLNINPLISKHLTKLELDGVHLEALIVDFSSFSVLEDVGLIYCDIDANKITSKSIKRLTTKLCRFNSGDARTCISIPSLVSLKLVNFFGRTPMMDSMPSLEDACVKFDDVCEDCCQYTGSWGCGNENCDGCSDIDDEKKVSLLLEGLSNATHLELINEPNMFIFEMDLRRCPTFRNLRTLLLNEWFVSAGLHGLVCILRHSPVLEELILLLTEVPRQMVEAGGGHDQMEQPFVMEHLNEVKVECQKENEWIKTVIKTLNSFGIPREKIIVEEISISS